MIHWMHKSLRLFRRNEDGGILVIEFVVMFPIIITLFLMGVELGIYSMRHMFLDRGLDVAVRQIRLTTNTGMTHASLKTLICDNTGFVDDCETTLRLEMEPMDPRNFGAFNQSPDCTDTSQPVTPVRGFNPGQEHQMMILRACVKFKPVFPSTGLGREFEKDGSGRARMISTAVFVQEPN